MRRNDVHCLDSSFILDYLDGDDDGRAAVESFLQANENRVFVAPAYVLFEAYAGAAYLDGRAGVDRMASDLEWIEPVPFTERHAREAAVIDAELKVDGTPINVLDVLIAGVARVLGATVVTRDGDFDRVDGLTVERY